ncbi:hypothetical protein I118_1037 [Bifidobacterium longum D2957]|nr:hypothetical protein I118_1037 [Bifidobacterium longum D2957]
MAGHLGQAAVVVPVAGTRPQRSVVVHVQGGQASGTVRQAVQTGRDPVGGHARPGVPEPADPPPAGESRVRGDDRAVRPCDPRRDVLHELLTSSPRLKPGDSSRPDDGRGSGL